MIITRTILNMSYTVFKTYSNNNPETLEFQLLCKDSDKNENITYTEHICNLSFKNTISFQHLHNQNNFTVRSVRDKTIEQIFNELDNICLTIKNHQFEITKIYDLEYSSTFENKIVKCFMLSDDKFNSKLDSISNQYLSPFYYRNPEVINYYKNERLKFQRKSKLIKLENHTNAN